MKLHLEHTVCVLQLIFSVEHDIQAINSAYRCHIQQNILHQKVEPGLITKSCPGHFDQVNLLQYLRYHSHSNKVQYERASL